MSESRLEVVKGTILQSIEALVPVAEHHHNKHARNGLLAQAALLNNLGARIELHQLPDGFVRSLINDVRLDTLMILTDLKVSLTFMKQELAAPTERLRLETAQRRVGFDGWGEGLGEGSRIPPDRPLSQILSDLSVVGSVEASLRKQALLEE